MYVASLAQMARRKSYWAPQRLGRIVWSICSNLPGQIELFRILSLPAFKSMVLLDPVFSFRHLSTQFLFRGLTAKERTASILHHYRFLISRMSNPILYEFGHSGIRVLEHQKNGTDYVVTLGMPPKNALWEGEGVLQLQADGAPIYHLQFTIVPGWVLNSEQRDVIFVQRLQGVKGRFQQISAATKAFRDVAPPLLLITALQGIAAAWEIREMACISAKSQISTTRDNKERLSANFKQAYDDFFLELGARHVSADFFSLPVPLEEKPIELIGNGHKARTRRKRAFRHEIANRVCHTILNAA